MPILPKKKLIFVHIPKTGGQSIYHALGGDLYNPNPNKKILWGPDGDFEYSHFTALEIKGAISTKKFKEYYMFTMVRNPFDRLVSLYFHKKLGRDTRFVSAEGLSFHQFVENLYEKFHLIPQTRQLDMAHVRPQHEYVYDKNDKMLVDHIFKYENYDEIQAFITTYGGSELPKINTTQHLNYRAYYTKEAHAMVSEMYAKDFKRFGYKTNL